MENKEDSKCVECGVSYWKDDKWQRNWCPACDYEMKIESGDVE